MNTIAAIEAVPATRLSELWLEQDFAEGKANLRFGQLTADVEFFYSATSVMFLQSDWATIAALNLPSGGPAYPLSVPGVRLKVEPGRSSSFLFAVYDGDPAGPGTGDEQLRKRNGLNFRTSDSTLIMAEVQLRRHHDKADAGLAQTLKVGMWSHRGVFDDPRYADDGRPLADPASSGRRARRKHNRGVYVVIDQQVYRPPGADAERGVTLFGRAAAAPSDRNAVSMFIDGGIVFAGVLPARPDDKFGTSFMISRFSAGVRGADQDQIEFSGRPGRARDYEANLELTYSLQVRLQWTLQPTLARVWHPNGDPTRRATVAGVRTLVRF